MKGTRRLLENSLAGMRRSFVTLWTRPAIKPCEQVRSFAACAILSRAATASGAWRTLKKGLVEEASALALVGAKDKGVRVRFEFTPEIGFVLADKVQIQQVLINLIRNAIEAMEETEKRELVISTASGKENMLEICVADTGPETAPRSARNCSSLSLRPNVREWASGCGSRAPSLRRMVALSRLSLIPGEARRFVSPCRL